MTEQEVRALFDRAIQAQQDCKRAFEALVAFSESIKKPDKPRVVNALSEWEDYTARLNRYEEERSRLEVVNHQAKHAWKEIEQTIRKFMPNGVWFVHGGYALGIAYTNWGGHSYYLTVEDLHGKDPGELPSLDRTYHGD
jgi:hypothetical protein